jgi:hypothetical protein
MFLDTVVLLTLLLIVQNKINKETITNLLNTEKIMDTVTNLLNNKNVRLGLLTLIVYQSVNCVEIALVGSLGLMVLMNKVKERKMKEKL